MDDALIEQAKKEDREAMGMIYSEYKDRVYNHIFRMVYHREEARDLTQDAFIRIFRKLHLFKGGSFDAWIYKVTTNLVFNHFARQNPVVKFDFPVPEESTLSIDTRIDIERALSKMPPVLRSMLLLKEVENFTCEEIADIFDIPVGTVKSRLSRARRIFKRFYGGEP